MIASLTLPIHKSHKCVETHSNQNTHRVNAGKFRGARKFCKQPRWNMGLQANNAERWWGWRHQCTRNSWRSSAPVPKNMAWDHTHRGSWSTRQIISYRLEIAANRGSRLAIPSQRPKIGDKRLNIWKMNSKILAAIQTRLPTIPMNTHTRVIKTSKIGCDVRLIHAEIVDPQLRRTANESKHRHSNIETSHQPKIFAKQHPWANNASERMHENQTHWLLLLLLLTPALGLSRCPTSNQLPPEGNQHYPLPSLPKPKEY